MWVTVRNLIAVGQTSRAFLVSHLSRSLKVVRTDTDRSATYDFIVVVQVNNGPISHHFQDKRRFRRKYADLFLPTCSLCSSPAEWLPP